MTLYAPTDVRAVTVPADRGGCGQPHTAPDDLPKGEHMAVDCPLCEPYLNTLGGHGWAPDPLHCALTPDERRQLDALDDQAKANRARTWSDPDAIGKALAAALNQHTAPQGGMLAQLRAEAAQLDEAGRAELAALLGLTTPAPAAAEPAAEPEPEPPAPADDDLPTTLTPKKAAPRKAAPKG